MAEADRISAEPTKAFFVDMFTRDIALEQAILDLVDNSVDGAKRLHPEPESRLDGRKVEIEFGADRFRIADNCGGLIEQLHVTMRLGLDALPEPPQLLTRSANLAWG